MATRILWVIVILALLNYTVSCAIETSFKFPKEEIPPDQERIVEAVLLTGNVIKFAPQGGRFVAAKNAIVGMTEEGTQVDIPIDEILYVKIKIVNLPLSALATVGVIIGAIGAYIGAAAILFGVMVAVSCPFVYSFDGEKYIFDAEPLGGAIAPGLKKIDYARLEHLNPVDGKYRLLLRNEMAETQYIDELKLLIIDHAPGITIIPDVDGNFHLVRNPITALSARDENGKNLMKFLKERDDVAWQTHLPTASQLRGKGLRHQLTVEFPKPSGAKSAKLVVNGGTAIWGSNMIREMLALRGRKVDEWYRAINTAGPELFELIDFIEREELYVLKIYVKEGEEWVQRGFIPGGGPLITEDRVISIDVSHVTGDKLIVRFNPPMGFWAIDYLGVDYEDHRAPEVKEAPVAFAQDQNGHEASEVLRAADDKYHVLREVGDWTKVNFDMPARPEGTERSIFLKTFGYYEIHLPKDQPEQTALIHRLLKTPGMIVEFSMSQYQRWRSPPASFNAQEPGLSVH